MLATDFATLTNQATTLAAKHGISEDEVKLRYFDGDSWVIVEDDQDLELAFTIARSGTKKILLCINRNASAANDVDMQDESQQAKGHMKAKKEKKDKSKGGIPRKALKNLIMAELERQAKDTFQKLLTSDDLPDADMTPDEAQAVHNGVSCDGCGVSPIVGIRYKCSVRKNFDYCAKCEERMGQEHAMLKIVRPEDNPDVMITMLDEE